MNIKKQWSKRREVSFPKRQENIFEVKHLGLTEFPHGVIVTDSDLLITSMNAAFISITGFQDGDALGRTCSFLQGPDTATQTRAAIRIACKNGRAFTGDILNYRKDGSQFWNDLSIAPVRNGEGVITNFVGIIRDVSDRKRGSDGRHEMLDRLEQLARQVPGMVYQFRLRPDGTIAFPFVSEASRSIYQLSPTEIQANPFLLFDCIEPDASEMVWQSIIDSAKDLTRWSQEFQVNLPDGTSRYLLGDSQPQRESDGSILWHGFVTDITQRKRLEEKMHGLAFHDKLTGLANRTLFFDRVDQGMLASHRSGKFGAVLFIDLDHFKPLNDQYGHAVGDALLVEIAARMKNCVRATDTVGRFGGDEFVILLNELSVAKAESIRQSVQIAEKIHAAISQNFFSSEMRSHTSGVSGGHTVSCSIGLAIFQGTLVSHDKIIFEADAAMYRAKRQGGGVIRVHELRP